MNNRICMALLLLASGALVVPGCGPGGEQASATGTITVEGAPVEGLEVRFDPQFEGGRQSIGFTDSAGYFEARATKDRAGVKPGKYIVRISGTQYLENETKVVAEIPPAYGSESTQEVEITPGSNTVDIDVEQP